VLGHILFVSSAVIVSRGLGIDVSFYDIGWMRSAVFLLTVLPLTVGGIGIREAGFAGLLYLYGVDRPTALAMPVVLLAIQVTIGAIGAIGELLRVTTHIQKSAGGRS
jgi:hypothetical protein